MDYLQTCSCSSGGVNQDLLQCAPCPPPMITYEQFHVIARSRLLCEAEVCTIARRCRLPEDASMVIACPEQIPSWECSLACTVISACIVGVAVIVCIILLLVFVQRRQKDVNQNTIDDVFNDRMGRQAAGRKTTNMFTNSIQTSNCTASNGDSTETRNAVNGKLNTTTDAESTNAFNGKLGTTTDATTINAFNDKLGTTTDATTRNAFNGKLGTTTDATTINAFNGKLGTTTDATTRNAFNGKLGTTTDATKRNAFNDTLGTTTDATTRNAFNGKLGTTTDATTRNAFNDKLGIITDATTRNAVNGKLYTTTECYIGAKESDNAVGQAPELLDCARKRQTKIEHIYHEKL